MTRTMHLLAWLFVLGAVALGLIVGPLMATYAFFVAALGFILVLTGLKVGHEIEDWRLGHPLRFHRIQRESHEHGH